MGSTQLGLNDLLNGENHGGASKDALRAGSLLRYRQQQESFEKHTQGVFDQLRLQQNTLFDALAEQAKTIKALQSTIQTQDADMQAHVQWIGDLKNTANFGKSLDDCRSRLSRLEGSGFSAILDSRFGDIARQLESFSELSTRCARVEATFIGLQSRKAESRSVDEVQKRITQLEDAARAKTAQIEDCLQGHREHESSCNSSLRTLAERLDLLAGVSDQQNQVQARLQKLEEDRELEVLRILCGDMKDRLNSLETQSKAQIALMQMELTNVQEALNTTSARVGGLNAGDIAAKLTDLSQKMQRLDKSFDDWTESEELPSVTREFHDQINESLRSLKREFDHFKAGQSIAPGTQVVLGSRAHEDEDRQSSISTETNDRAEEVIRKSRRGGRRTKASTTADRLRQLSRRPQTVEPTFAETIARKRKRGRPRKAKSKNIPPTHRRSQREPKPKSLAAGMLSWSEALEEKRAARG